MKVFKRGFTQTVMTERHRPGKTVYRRLSRIVLWLGGMLMVVFLVLGCEEDYPDLTSPAQFMIEKSSVDRNPEARTFHFQAHILYTGDAEVDSVWAQLMASDGAAPFLEIPMYDDGTHGDLIPLNGWFSYKAGLNEIRNGLPAGEEVSFLVRYSARNSAGEMIEQTTEFAEYPVRIDTIIAPDTIVIGTGEPRDMLVLATDSSGYEDIIGVKFRQYSRNDTLTIDEFPTFYSLTFVRSEGPLQSLYYWGLNVGSGTPPGKRTMQFVAEDQVGSSDTMYTEIHLVEEGENQ